MRAKRTSEFFLGGWRGHSAASSLVLKQRNDFGKVFHVPCMVLKPEFPDQLSDDSQRFLVLFSIVDFVETPDENLGRFELES